MKIAEGGNPWLRTTNNHVGRQVWEFDPNLGTPEQLREVEDARENFWNHRFEQKHSSDLLMRMQVLISFNLLMRKKVSYSCHLKLKRYASSLEGVDFSPLNLQTQLMLLEMSL